VRGRLCSTDSVYVKDIGKVLAGIQVPPGDSAEFDKILRQVGYAFVEETNNAVYKRHLRG
jgi:threonine dehydratase